MRGWMANGLRRTIKDILLKREKEKKKKNKRKEGKWTDVVRIHLGWKGNSELILNTGKKWVEDQSRVMLFTRNMVAWLPPGYVVCVCCWTGWAILYQRTQTKFNVLFAFVFSSKVSSQAYPIHLSSSKAWEKEGKNDHGKGQSGYKLLQQAGCTQVDRPA